MGLADKVINGDVRAAGRLMRGLENETLEAAKELEKIYPHTGKAYIVGLTGAPGVGKSTLIDSLINSLIKKGMTIGVVAIDPTSPFTGGAILGDRIRMQQHVSKDVFVRSMATRGWVGGLAKTTMSMIHVFDAMGKDIILVETVGSGQGEVDINRVADTTIVILSPAAGDEMQMIKAGIMEIADIFVVNKADKGGADNIAMAIDLMLRLKPRPDGEWMPPVLMTSAATSTGVNQLVDEIFNHRDFITSGEKLEAHRRERAKFELIATIESSVRNYVHLETGAGGYLEKLVDDLAKRNTNPHAAATEIINRFSKQFKSARV